MRFLSPLISGRGSLFSLESALALGCSAFFLSLSFTFSLLGVGKAFIFLWERVCCAW